MFEEKSVLLILFNLCLDVNVRNTCGFSLLGISVTRADFVPWFSIFCHGF